MIAALLRHLGTKSVRLTAEELQRPATVLLTTDDRGTTIEVK